MTLTFLLCLYSQDDVFIREEIADDVPECTSIDRVESAGVSELMSEGVELLERLEPALAQDLLDSVHESCPESPLANRLASRLAQGNNVLDEASTSSPQDGHLRSNTNSMLTSSQDCTTDHENCDHGRRAAANQEDAMQQQIGRQKHGSNSPHSADFPSTGSSPYAGDVFAVFQSCTERNGNHNAVALADPVRLRQELLAHGFTSKQCNAILTRLEVEGAEDRGRKVSLEQLRSAMIPVLHECAKLVDLRSTQAPANRSNCGGEERPVYSGESLDDSTVSIIRDADATLAPRPSTPEKDVCRVGNLEGTVSPWKEESATAARAESTQMDSMCLSDIAENSKEQGEFTCNLSQATSAHTTPQKTSSKSVQDDVEDKARRIAAVCKKGVWQAWRGNPHGLEPIYSLSLWHQTQTLMINCGLVDVLEMLLAGVTSELIEQGQQEVPADKKLRVRLDGSVVQSSTFSKKHAHLVRRLIGILINLALRRKGAESCRRAKGEGILWHRVF